MPTRYLRLGPREQDTGSDDTSRRTEQDEEEFWPKLDKKTADRIGILNRWIYPVCRSVVTEKFWDVIGLYLDPPEKALVLCCDEKGQCQALERTQRGLPLKKGYSRTHTHDYIRHGTITLFAALSYLEGKIISRPNRPIPTWNGYAF